MSKQKYYCYPGILEQNCRKVLGLCLPLGLKYSCYYSGTIISPVFFLSQSCFYVLSCLLESKHGAVTTVRQQSEQRQLKLGPAANQRHS
jgi:hypothetical protein